MTNDASFSDARNSRSSERALFAGIVGSNVFPLIVAGICEFLALRGIVSAKAASIVLVFVWLLIVLGIVISGPIWGRKIGRRTRILLEVFSAVAFAVLLFEANRLASSFEKPPNTLTGLSSEADSERTMTCNSVTFTGTLETGTPPTRARFTYATDYDTVASGGGLATEKQNFYAAGTFPIRQFVAGLTESTTYYYRLEVSNRFGVKELNIESFATPACKPKS